MTEPTREAIQRACISEWDNVNDPPCHPSDAEWRPCWLCIQVARESADVSGANGQGPVASRTADFRPGMSE